MTKKGTCYGKLEHYSLARWDKHMNMPLFSKSVIIIIVFAKGFFIDPDWP